MRHRCAQNTDTGAEVINAGARTIKISSSPSQHDKEDKSKTTIYNRKRDFYIGGETSSDASSDEDPNYYGGENDFLDEYSDDGLVRVNGVLVKKDFYKGQGNSQNQRNNYHHQNRQHEGRRSTSNNNSWKNNGNNNQYGDGGSRY